MSPAYPIAVIDVETTGLFASRHDRVVEVAVVVVHSDGRVEREFAFLVNPGRDIGPSHIHGLTSEDILDAPRFEDIAGRVVETMEGCVAIAGHNVRFDREFMESEFTRMGYSFPACHDFCTLALFRGKLTDCCQRFGIPFNADAHQALADARATAGLLARHFREETHRIGELSNLEPIHWPILPPSVKQPLCRGEAQRRQTEPPSYIQRLLAVAQHRSSSEPGQEAVFAYRDLLDRVLEDRRVEDAEVDVLIETACKWGLDGQFLGHIHRDYLDELMDAAVADGIVTDSELRDLALVARLLGLEQPSMEKVFAHVAAKLAAKPSNVQLISQPMPAAVASLSGKSVCFTGELQCCFRGERLSRETAQELAANAGFKVESSVTKSLDILVVADPHTQSGKANKARQYGVRVMHEPVFWKAIGVEVE